MRKTFDLRFLAILGLALLLGCAAPAPTATPTRPPAAAPSPTVAGPTPTKAPTATPTKRPMVKAVMANPSRNFPQMTWVVAEGKGYYREEGLDLEIVITGSGAKGLAAVVGQSAHLTSAASPEVVSAVTQQQPIQAIALTFQGEDYTMVVNPEVAKSRGVTPQTPFQERIKAIKGLKFASSSPGSGSDAAARFMLHAGGLDPDRDAEISYIGIPAMLPALQAGSVDAFVTTNPDSAQAIAGGLGIALVTLAKDFSETREDVVTPITTHKNVIKGQPEIPEAALRAVWRALRLLKENKADAKEAYRKTAFPDMDRAVFDTAFEAIYAAHVPDSPAITKKAFEATLDYRSKSLNEPRIQISYEDFYNPTFMEAAKKQLGY